LEIDRSVGEIVSATRQASHVAFLHDDVLVGPGWDSLLMDCLDTRAGAMIAIPQTNAEKPEAIQNQGELLYDPVTLVGFDQAVIARQLRFIGRGQYSSMLSPVCAMLDAAALREAAHNLGAGCVILNDLLKEVLTAHPQVWSALDVWVQNAGTPTGQRGEIRLAPSTPLIAART
jgi:hypothetical protein